MRHSLYIDVRTISFAACVGGALLVAGCASTGYQGPIAAGDTAAVDLVCTTPEGAAAFSTIAQGIKGRPVSPIMVPRTIDEPLTLLAGQQVKPATTGGEPGFDEVLGTLVAREIIGMKQGETRSFPAQASPLPGRSSERTIQMARVRVRPREAKMTVEEYRSRSRKEPETGQVFTIDPSFPGRVETVDDKNVVIRFTALGTTILTPFGPGTVQEKADRYEVKIEPAISGLVRSGPLVGRIVSADERYITIDYSHPFGGVPLSCTATITSVEPATVPAQAPAPSPESAARSTLESAVKQAISSGKPASVNLDAAVSGARSGDLVRVEATATLADGSLVSTTSETIAKAHAGRKVDGYQDPPRFEPLDVLAGEKTPFPGVGDAVIGMKQGETRRVVIPADKGFGPADPAKVVRLSRVRTMPTTLRMAAEEYVRRYRSFPVIGKEVQFSPYVTAMVEKISEQDVLLKASPLKVTTITEPFGMVEVRAEGDQIRIVLSPVPGSPFPIGDQQGRVATVDGDAFTVDTNHPLAGKELILELEALGVSPTAELAGIELPWSDDHEKGLAQAAVDKQPAVLVLYADWCTWCKRLFGESLKDPRVTALKDSFAWVKVNSDKNLRFKELYGQEGFPMVVLFDRDGKKVRTIDGFRSGQALQQELLALLGERKSE